jgi:hypothetical protein
MSAFVTFHTDRHEHRKAKLYPSHCWALDQNLFIVPLNKTSEIIVGFEVVTYENEILYRFTGFQRNISVPSSGWVEN